MPERAAAPDAHVRLELDATLRAIGALPERYREPLLLVVSGLSYEEAGRVLDLPLNTVKIRVHRARLALADALSPSSS